MKHNIEFRPGRPEDIEVVEELILRTFTSTFRPALGNIPLETQVRVQSSLRRARSKPMEEVIVALEGPTLVGVIMGKTAATSDRGQFSTLLRALSPLGILGTLRYLLVNLTTYTHYKPAPGELYSYGMAIAPAYRRRGIARALLQQVDEKARRAGKTMVCGFVVAQNTASRTLCQKVGYHEVSVQNKPLRGWVLGEPEVIRVEKPLSPQNDKDQEDKL